LQTTTLSESAKPRGLEQRGSVGGLIACVDISSELSALPEDLSRGVFGIFGAPFVAPFRTALDPREPVVDLSKIDAIDQQFFGHLLMLRERRRKCRSDLKFAGITTKAHSAFRRNGFDFRLQQ
jgi:hypothetical protein